MNMSRAKKIVARAYMLEELREKEKALDEINKVTEKIT